MRARNSEGFSVGAFETGILGRTRLDIKLSGLPTDSNTYGTIPDVTVMTMRADGRVGIGISDPAVSMLTVYGGTVHPVAIFGQTHSANGVGVFGFGNVQGVYGSSSAGHGIYGDSSTGYAGYFNGNVYVTGSVTQNSDVRLKQSVGNLGYGLTEVLRLRPVSWRWIDKPDLGLQLGLIAQEIETVLPELVTTSKDAEQTKGLNYIGLVPVMIRAIQEQQVAIEQKEAALQSLKAESAALQHRNAELDARLAAVEQALRQVLEQQTP